MRRVPTQNYAIESDCYNPLEMSRKEGVGVLIIQGLWYSEGSQIVESKYWLPESLESGFLPEWAITIAPPPIERLTMAERHLVATGWPATSFWSMRGWNMLAMGPPDFAFPRSSLDVYRGIDVHDQLFGTSCDSTPFGMLPFGPVWKGIVLNTLFYAAVLWGLLRLPFVVRRLQRRSSGLCLRCGYDLTHADHAACPECGAEAGGR